MVICKIKEKIKNNIQDLRKDPRKILKNPYFYLFCILIFALFLRLYFFVGMGFYDDPTYLNTAYKVYSGVKHIPNQNFWELRIGVYYPIVFFWKLFGINELSSSLFFILCSLGSITVTYFIAKEFFSEKIALFSAFMLSIFPLNVLYSTQIGPDIPFQFLTGLAVLFFIYHEKNKPHSNVYALFCGVNIAIAYTVKSLIILLMPLFIVYLVIEIIKKKSIKKIFPKKKILRYLIILVGFLVVFSIHTIHFYNVSGEWFFVENSRGYVLTHGLNENDDHYWYLTEMFSLESDVIKDLDFIPSEFSAKGGYFQNIHDPPMFGFLYYFVIIASMWYIFKRKYNKFFLVLWWFGFFFFLEFFLQFYCTTCVEYCVYPRIPRFLSIFSIPVVILASGILYMDFSSFKKKNTYKKMIPTLKVISMIFLFITSILYIQQSSTFIRNGIGDIRETAEFLQEKPPKPIYVAHGVFKHKSSFFFKYNASYIDDIRIFDCSEINCDDDYYNSGEYISDAYVILEATSYWIGFNESEGYLPDFCKDPPDDWILLKKIEIPNYGIFNDFNPKIYYVPAKSI